MFDLIKQIETKSYILKREANQIKNESKIAILFCIDGNRIEYEILKLRSPRTEITVVNLRKVNALILM